MAPEVEAGTYRKEYCNDRGPAAQQNNRSFAYDISMFFFETFSDNGLRKITANRQINL